MNANAKVVSLTDRSLPEPLVPPGTRVGGDYMPLYCKAVLNSQALANMPAASRWAALRLWMEAWMSEHTTGTLPNDDRLLAQYAGYGGDKRAWQKMRVQVLDKFILCSDGRLHHPTLAKAVKDLLERREKANQRKREQREREAAAREKPGNIPEETGELPDIFQDNVRNFPNRDQQNQSHSMLGHAPVPPEGKGREGKVRDTEPTDVGSDAAKPASPQPPATTKKAKPPPDFSDPTVLARHQLWDEGQRILAKVMPDASEEKRKELIGSLASAHGGGVIGGVKTIQVLRDVEYGRLAGTISPDVGRYLRDLIHRAKGTSKKPERTDPRGESAALRIKREMEARAEPADDPAVAQVLPSDGPVIDGEFEEVAGNAFLSKLV